MGANLDPLFADAALLDQAERVCRMRLAKDPGNPATQRSLAQLCRKQGALQEAADLCARLARRDPDDRNASYLHAIFSGSALPPAAEGPIAAPFVLLKHVLPPEVHQSLLPLVVGARDELAPAQVNAGEYKPGSRESLDLPNPLRWPVMKRFHGMLRKLLPTLLPRLNVPAFEAGNLEFKIRVYRDGHFFRTHQDASQNAADVVSHRKVSYVYFFHQVPRPFTGGDLLLFDTDVRADSYETASFTRVTPEDNAMVVFPSQYYHCVVPLKCRGDELTDSRFVVNGHLSERVDAPVAKSPDETVHSSHG